MPALQHEFAKQILETADEFDFISSADSVEQLNKYVTLDILEAGTRK